MAGLGGDIHRHSAHLLLLELESCWTAALSFPRASGAPSSWSPVRSSGARHSTDVSRREGGAGHSINFALRVAEIRATLPPGTPVEIWFQDEMRVGQKNKLTYRWARKGSRPRAIHDQRTQSTYLFGAVCPERGAGAALVLRPLATPRPCSSISTKSQRKSPPGAHAVLILDQAG